MLICTTSYLSINLGYCIKETDTMEVRLMIKEQREAAGLEPEDTILAENEWTH